MTNIAIFASGSGTNAEKIMARFQHHAHIKVTLVVTNNPQAGVIARAATFSVPVEVLEKGMLAQGDQMINFLEKYHTDWIVLAGFMRKIPSPLIAAFPNRILNIHPALLPAYGGKGMYGMHVHRAVVEAGETSTGISIHYVNEHYDEGKMILQVSCPVYPDDTPETVAARVHQLEHHYYPEVVEEVVSE